MFEYKTRQQKRKFYKSTEWQALRIKVLERDNYECQECKRNGYVYTDKHDPDKRKRLDVDHIQEIEFHPDLALEIDNLEVLCVKCHNKKHNRFNDNTKQKKWDDEMW